MDVTATALKLDRVSFAYSDQAVLRAVSLEIQRGERVAIMGPSGCGKSTLLLIAAGVLVPDDGSVVVGDEVAQRSADARAELRRRQVGMVFQFSELIVELSLRDNVALMGELAGQRRRMALARADDLLSRVGLAEFRHRSPSQVSGGQAQRTAIARALIHEPSLLLADEPTGALDSRNASEVLDLLIRCTVDLGAGILVATHDEDVAARCDRVIEMRDGELLTARNVSL